MRPVKAIFYFLFLLCFYAVAQQPDTSIVLKPDSSDAATTVVKKDKKWSKPAKAALMSTVLPGLGQVYNNRIWKVPIVYGLILGSAYMVHYNSREFKKYDYVYTRMTAPEKLVGSKTYNNLDTAAVYQTYGGYSEDYIRYNATYHRDWRDKFVIITVLMYAANIIDAHVDAHLKDFNVSEDVSMRVRPSILPTYRGIQSSLELSFYFKNNKVINENSISRLW
ncbi:MAG TPA: DUF5683 domain-containing protein [Cytophagales bacterium]|nr:DUF5683 domain-containing protein [Cytophagales bacterium]